MTRAHRMLTSAPPAVRQTAAEMDPSFPQNFHGTPPPTSVARSHPFQSLRAGEADRVGRVAPPRSGFLGTDPNAQGTGEVTEEAQVLGWTVQRKRPRRHLPVAIVRCVVCWQEFDPNDMLDHDCLVARASRQ